MPCCEGPLGDATLNCPDKTAGSIADGLISTGAEPSLDGIDSADGIEDDLREQAVRRGFGDLLS